MAGDTAPGESGQVVNVNVIIEVSLSSEKGKYVGTRLEWPDGKPDSVAPQIAEWLREEDIEPTDHGIEVQ